MFSANSNGWIDALFVTYGSTASGQALLSADKAPVGCAQGWPSRKLVGDSSRDVIQVNSPGQECSKEAEALTGAWGVLILGTARGLFEILTCATVVGVVG